MPEKDPTSWHLATWALALAMAMGGGFVNWYAKVKVSHTRAFNLLELIGEMVTSGFVGIGVFMTLDGFGQPPSLCAAGAGIGGHMAARLLFILERLIEQKLKKVAS
ncbi:MAG: hypothetical protein GX466_08730 [Candidatus Cloacimonetes bacterium]|nr:hypothetical protein [Candidatus Cloacimonadota bacterium]